MRRYYIKTYGCQANVHDAAKLAGVLVNAGYQEAPEEASADIILVLTCVVRQNAEDRAAWFTQSLKGVKKLNPNLKIALCGCLVTEPGRDVKKQFPHVDLFIPPNSPEVLAHFLRPPVPSPQFLVPHSPFVSIMNGCDNYCSYCVVPYVRGRETSRPPDEVLAEIKELIEQGVTDITLLGQNVNSYKYGLSNLLIAIQQLGIRSAEGGAFIIRFMTSHPRDLSDDLIEAVARLDYVAKEFHLPLQSGDDEILKAMNRGYTVEYFLDRVKKIRELIPNARITSDLMVGFPGETEVQFENTLKILAELRCNAVNMFAYSPRPMTAAAKMPNQVSEEVKQARLQKLIELNRDIIRPGGSTTNG
jgi:tRNA-2-methylthio-N6-dimethylallyladenosine synthase